ncbi:hypothetical protein [Tenacibaculum aiptasiae]|uniref:hypothetical protein n=1 Tax=Tenacibaculum aiptasiae TaxID=426481 RepID=UPI00232DFE81|nr:hypothetical protein [Tenacibaculum aiptasiae]
MSCEILQIMLLSTWIIIIIYLAQKGNRKKGCLEGKSYYEKEAFFKWLYELKSSDICQYNKEVQKLLKIELRHFNQWINYKERSFK